MPRLLGYRNKDENPAVFTPWIITYGAGYRETKEKAREVNETISNSRTWSNTSPAKIPTLQVVTRRAPNLKDTFFKRKRLALGSSSNSTVPCTTPGEKKEGAPLYDLHPCKRYFLCHQKTTVLQGHKVETANRKILFMQQLANSVEKNNVYVGKICMQLERAG